MRERLGAGDFVKKSENSVKNAALVFGCDDQRVFAADTCECEPVTIRFHRIGEAEFRNALLERCCRSQDDGRFVRERIRERRSQAQGSLQAARQFLARGSKEFRLAKDDDARGEILVLFGGLRIEPFVTQPSFGAGFGGCPRGSQRECADECESKGDGAIRSEQN